MKIFMITQKDGPNISLAKIADAFLRKGHEITIYAPFYAENVLKFFNKKIPRFPIGDLTESVVLGCDLLFASSTSVMFLGERNILSVKRPIIMHNYLVNGAVSGGG